MTIERDSVPAPAPSAQNRAARLAAVWSARLPGILLAAAIAAIAFALRLLPGMGLLSPMIIAIVVAIAFHNLVGTPTVTKVGTIFSMRTLLRCAIVLLGLQLTVMQVLSVGPIGLAVIVAAVAGTFLFTTWFGKLIGVDRRLAELIAAGTAICGASAIVATNAVTQAHDEDVAYAVASITIWGSIAIFLYPILSGLLGLDPLDYGLWAGASIHEIAQVVAATFQGGEEAGEVGTVVKLTRVIMLAPLVLAVGLATRHRLRDAVAGQPVAGSPVPFFVLGFAAMVAVNSLIAIPESGRALLSSMTSFLLTMALAAMGLTIDIRKLRLRGIRPLLLGLAATIFISGFSLLLIEATA